MASKANSAFIEAVIKNDVAAVARALDAGADINAVFPKDGRYPPPAGRWASKGTPLLVFVATGNKQWLDMLDLLIARGANLDAADTHGKTAVAAAGRDGVKAAVEKLLDAGADPNRLDDRDEGLLQHIVSFHENGHALLQRALAAGANPNVGLKDKNWGVPRKPTYTPLYTAALRGNLGAVELLLAAGADPNTGRIKDHWNVNPLGHAIKANNRPMVMALLRGGADLGLLDDHYRERLPRLVKNAAELIEEGKAARTAGPASKKPAAKKAAGKKPAAKKPAAKKPAAKKPAAKKPAAKKPAAKKKAR
jgi:ankyrin repeat protein